MLRYILIISLFFFSTSIYSQNRFTFFLGAGVNKSIGKDKAGQYISNQNNTSVGYFKRRKFKNPCLTLLTNISYSICNKISIGLQTGMYLHYEEKYTSSAKRTTLSLPLQLTCKLEVFHINRNEIGIFIAGGNIFFSINDRVEKYKNGTLLNTAVYYSCGKRGILKVGLEKQTDKVSFYFKGLNVPYPDEVFRYSLKRSAFSFSYNYAISKTSNKR